jgi:RNA polymerase sigma-70 factor, ECF subfamily
MRNDAAGPRPIFSSHRTWPRRDNSDEELIAKIAAGNRLAMQVLYARHHTRIYRLLLRIAGDADLVEGLLAETFLSAWRHAPRFDGSSTVSTWLVAIARRKADAALQRDAATQGDAPRPSIVDPIPERAAALRAAHRGQKLRTCLARLPREHREIIDLVYYHGKSLPEVAGITGMSHDRVRARMLHARRQLSQLLEEDAHCNQDSMEEV